MFLKKNGYLNVSFLEFLLTEKVLAEVREKEELQVQFRPNGSRYFFHETNLQKISEMEK